MQCALSEKTQSVAGSQVSHTRIAWLGLASRQMRTHAENSSTFRASLLFTEAESEVVRCRPAQEEADLSSNPSIPTSCGILSPHFYKGLEFSLPGSFEDKVT